MGPPQPLPARRHSDAFVLLAAPFGARWNGGGLLKKIIYIYIYMCIHTTPTLKSPLAHPHHSRVCGAGPRAARGHCRSRGTALPREVLSRYREKKNNNSAAKCWAFFFFLSFSEQVT